MQHLSPDDLIAAARRVVGHFACSQDASAGGVAAALVTRSGKIFTGICIDTSCSPGHCAESSAISEMLKARETAIASIVAVDENGEIMPPCGRCGSLSGRSRRRTGRRRSSSQGTRLCRCRT